MAAWPRSPCATASRSRPALCWWSLETNSPALTRWSIVRMHPSVRMVIRTLALATALLAAAVVSTLTIDLGPSVRQLAEREGSRQIERPLHIGRISIHLLFGRVLVEGLRIDGLAPTDRPFFVADRVSVSLDWSKAIRPRPQFI